MKKGAATIYLLAVLMFLVSCGGTGAFESAVKSNEYSKASSVYAEKIQGNAEKEKEAQQFLESYLDNAWQDYLDEKITDTEFEAILETVEQIDTKFRTLYIDTLDIELTYPLVEESKEAYQKGISQMDEGNLEAAMISFSNVKPVDKKNYEDATAQYENAEKLYVADIVSKCEAKINSGDFAGTIELIERAERTAVNYCPEFEILKTKASTGRFENIIHECAEAKDYIAMLKHYDEAVEDGAITVSPEITQFVTDTVSEYRQDVIDRSIDAYKSGGYEAAIPVISEGLLVLEDDSLLIQYEELYKSCIPVKLSEITVLNTNSSPFCKGSVKDAYGNRYEGPYVDLCSYQSEEEYLDFFLNRQYNTFDATYFARNGMSNSFTVKFRIYADNVEIHSSGSLCRTDEPNTIKLDVTNVRTLRLEAYSDDYTFMNTNPGIEVVNAVLTRATLTDVELNIK